MLAAADRARDERRWAEAADRYRTYLVNRPDDSAIWVQFGHALKESGNLAEAEGAYLRSLELAPEVADTHLQLGHLYKKRRNVSKAVEAYRQALKTDGSLLDARRELISLGISLDGSRKEPGTFVDLSDVFFYLRHHPTVSGIQRVQLGIATAIIAMSAANRSGVLFLSETEDRQGYVIVDDVFVAELAEELGRTETAHDRLIAIMRSATQSARRYRPIAQDTVLILGAFWVLEDVAERVIALRRSGAIIGTLIHDIIPITHPEFCVKSLTEAFTSSFFSVLSVIDFILTVSDYSGRRVCEFMARNGIVQVPVRTLKSAHCSLATAADSDAVSSEIHKVLNEKYALYVSTIEVRKNHGYLFQVWKRLIEEREGNVPRLVLVGRPGWRVRDLMEQLESTANLNGRILILHDLPDSTLAALYRSALFSVFPSFEEGWGLPIGESLAYGRPCIAAKVSSIPEVAGDFADYLDPLNVSDGYEKIVRLIDDDEFREQRARYIQENFKPRTWDEVARDLLEITRTLAAGALVSRKPLEPPRLNAGFRQAFGHGGETGRFITSGAATIAHLAFVSGWYPLEDFGRWMRGKESKLEFLVEDTSEEPVFLVLDIKTVPWLKSTQLLITVNDVAHELISPTADRSRIFRLQATPDRGKVVVEFSAIGEVEAGNDPRKDLCFGLCALGYAKLSDLSSRVMLLEEFAFGVPLRAATVG